MHLPETTLAINTVWKCHLLPPDQCMVVPICFEINASVFLFFFIFFTYYFLDCENSILFPDPDRCSLLFHNIFQTSNSKRPFKILKLSQTFKTLLEPCRPNWCTEYTMYSFHFFLCIFFSQELKRCFSAKGSHTCCKMQWLHRSSLFKAIKFASFVKTV